LVQTIQLLHKLEGDTDEEKLLCLADREPSYTHKNCEGCSDGAKNHNDVKDIPAIGTEALPTESDKFDDWIGQEANS
jgi:hypothetical protein